MSIIQLNDVSKTYGKLKAVDHVSLSASQGAILVLLGPSGCGKTTTLRLIAGLERPDTGSIILNDNTVAGKSTWIPPEERHIGMVFQDYALFPHLSVEDNIAFPLNRMPNPQRKQRIGELLVLVGLEGLGARYPHELSGGQQQRVALARALAPYPQVILLDEPFSNLDAALRKQMREDVRDIIKQAGATAVFVTHDQEEAMSIGDSVAVMRDGHLLQLDAPRDLYLNPVDEQVAAFLGEANLLPGEANGDSVACALGDLPLAIAAHGKVEVLLRPEMLMLSFDDTNASIDDVRFYGYYQMVSVQHDSGVRLDVRIWATEAYSAGQRVRVNVRGAVTIV